MAQNLKNISKFSVLSKFSKSFSTSIVRCEDKLACDTAAAVKDHSIGNFINPSNFQKKLLVWTKKYQNMESIPAQVPLEKWNKARDIFRIRISNLGIAGTLIGALVFVISGKNAAARGESVEQMNLEWHQEYERTHAQKKN